MLYEEHVAQMDDMQNEIEKREGEISALRADLKALAVTAKPIYDHLDRRIKGDVLSRLSVFVIGELGEALARDGVQEILDQATSRAAATSGD